MAKKKVLVIEKMNAEELHRSRLVEIDTSGEKLPLAEHIKQLEEKHGPTRPNPRKRGK